VGGPFTRVLALLMHLFDKRLARKSGAFSIWQLSHLSTEAVGILH